MFTGIVFSNNSPSRLEEFFQSALNNEISIFEFCVLYNPGERCQEHYDRVFAKFNITNSIKETDFKENLLSILNGATKLVAFFKDTNYFFSKIKPYDLNQLMMSDEDIFCFSLILGKNIKHCYYNDVYNILLNEEYLAEDVVKWNWTKHYLDFGRPLELGGGHIFHTKEIFKMFKKWKYTDIQTLEDCFDSLDYYPKEHMASFTNSVLVDVNQKTEEAYKLLGVHDFSGLDRIVIEI